MSTPRLLVPSLGLALLTLTGGCQMHSPEGGALPFTGGTHTFYSTEAMTKSVTMIDLRTGQPFFEMDVPVGSQLTFDFRPDEGDDPVNTPDIMRYEVWPIGTTSGKLRNAMSVPNAASRRIDVSMIQGTSYAEAPPDEQYRTDQVLEQADWWTPEGGPMPDDRRAEIYDG